ncbi:MAG: GntP family permease [Sphingomonadales bacterium]
MIEFAGLIGGLTLLIYMAMKGINIMIAAPICASFVGILGGVAWFPQLAQEGAPDMATSYMLGFSGFIASWFLMFMLGAMFGKVMEDSGAAESIAHWILHKLGPKQAPLAIVLTCAILTYGGVSVFIVAFSVYPMALALFKQADLPRRFLPAVISFGSVTFTMTTAGSPEIQNWIPIKFLGTTSYAGWEVSIIVAVFMATFGYIWMKKMVGRAVENGEKYDDRLDDPKFDEEKNLPDPIISMIPLAFVLGCSFGFHDLLEQNALVIALFAGIISAIFINKKYFKNLSGALSSGTAGALIAIGNTASVVGFGTVAKASPAFMIFVDAMTALPGHELLSAAIAVTVIAGLTGSASGGQSIALPILAPHYLETGVDPEALHRVVAISSGALDSLPHNGYIVTTIRSICGENHKTAYAPLAALTVIVPLFGLALALGLFIFWG